MLITDTVKGMSQKSEVRSQKQRSFFIICYFIIFILAGCTDNRGLKQAKEDVLNSQKYYEAAIAQYKKLIAIGRSLDSLYLELGKLYFNRGNFDEAIEAFSKTKDLEAKKFAAISYYRLGNFTDALEIFNKYGLSGDDECLYYHGLTCEKLNLFDQALGVYKKIKDGRFKIKTAARIDIIEKQGSLLKIKDIDAKINGILQNAPAQDKYPQAGALILYCDEKTRITPQNTEVSYLHYVIKILNERGKESFAETGISYDSTYERVELDYARTIKPDGTVVDVGSRHIRDVSKYLNFPLYSNARVYIISFPEITEGCCIEYRLKVYRSQLINNKDFVLSYPVQTSEPVISATFSVALAKDRPLRLKIINDKYNDFAANLNPEVKEKEGFLIYSWQFKDIPQIIPESHMPPAVQVNPAILISSFNSWQDIYNWWWKLAKDKIVADGRIKEKVAELTGGLLLEEEKVRAIYNFCAQKIRYVGVEYGQAGYEPHKAEDIFKNKYGDCKDKAVLLVTMLKEAGFSAYPVLISTRDYYSASEDFPAVMFNHCIACVSLKGKLFFLDPTAETCPFGDLPKDDQGRKVLLVKEDGYVLADTPKYQARHNLIKEFFKIKVSSDESIEAQKSIYTYGIFDQGQRYWLLYTQPELIQEGLKERIQGVSIGAKLENYNIKNLANLNEPIVLSYSFHGPEYFTRAGNLRIMPQLTTLDVSLVAKERRKYAVDFGILESRETIFEIEIPEGFVIKYMPENVVEENTWLKYEIEYNRCGNNKICFRQKEELKKDRVPESEYPNFKSFFEILAKKIKQRIVVEKAK